MASPSGSSTYSYSRHWSREKSSKKMSASRKKTGIVSTPPSPSTYAESSLPSSPSSLTVSAACVNIQNGSSTGVHSASLSSSSPSPCSHYHLAAPERRRTRLREAKLSHSRPTVPSTSSRVTLCPQLSTPSPLSSVPFSHCTMLDRHSHPMCHIQETTTTVQPTTTTKQGHCTDISVNEPVKCLSAANDASSMMDASSWDELSSLSPSPSSACQCSGPVPSSSECRLCEHQTANCQVSSSPSDPSGRHLNLPSPLNRRRASPSSPSSSSTSLFSWLLSSFSLRSSLFLTLLLIFSCMLHTADSCSSRSTPKPRPPTPTTRPNITFQTYACPEAYAKWYCLNGATCFSVRIGESILYNCECADGYMGQRCEFKDLDGSYLPSREKILVETAGIAGGVTLAVLLVFVLTLSYYTYVRNHLRARSPPLLGDDAADYAHLPGGEGPLGRASFTGSYQDNLAFVHPQQGRLNQNKAPAVGVSQYGNYGATNAILHVQTVVESAHAPAGKTLSSPSSCIACMSTRQHQAPLKQSSSTQSAHVLYPGISSSNRPLLSAVVSASSSSPGNANLC